MTAWRPFMVVPDKKGRLLNLFHAQARARPWQVGQRIVEVVILAQIAGMEVVMNDLHVKRVLGCELLLEQTRENPLAQVVIFSLTVKRTIRSVQRITKITKPAVLRGILLEITRAGVRSPRA